MPLQNDLNSGSPLPLSESRLPNRNGRFNRSDRNKGLLVWCSHEERVHNTRIERIEPPPCVYLGNEDEACWSGIEMQSPRCGRALGFVAFFLILIVAL